MKKIIFAIILLTGCKQDNVITYKSYYSHDNWKAERLPDGICGFMFNGVSFQDSCNKYSIGDTIKGRSVTK